MSRVVALCGKNSFTCASCDGRALRSTADALQPFDQPLARGEHLALPAGQQMALERAAGMLKALPDTVPALVVQLGRKMLEAEAGLAQHQQLEADQGRGPAAGGGRRLDRREQAVEAVEQPRVRLSLRKRGGGQRAAPFDAG